ncbi:Tim44 domain-containing protein [Leptospira interrogans]
MPQETDGSALISLFYAMWIYWIVSSWMEQLLRRAQAENEQNQSDEANEAAAHSMPTTTGQDIDALISETLQREMSITIDDFLAKALTSYEAIVAAFNSGDRETLRKLVSPDVYETFSHAISAREATRTRVETMFARIDPPEIVDGRIDAAHLEISVRFAGESFSLFRNAAGQLLEKKPSACRNIDVWTFARPLSPRSSTWCVVATGVAA